MPFGVKTSYGKKKKEKTKMKGDIYDKFTTKADSEKALKKAKKRLYRV